MTMLTCESWSFRYKAPEGSVTIVVMDIQPIQLQVFVGKAGTVVSALAFTITALINHILKTDDIDSVIELLADISSDTSIWNASNNSWCRSLAEAISFALLEFSRKKRRKNDR